MAPRTRHSQPQASQAGPSRRRTRTASYQDAEADPSPQASPRRAAQPTPTRKPTTQSTRTRSNVEADLPERFDRANFKNQPIDVTSERQIRNFLSNWSFPAGDAEDKAVSLLADTARAVEDAGGDDELAMQLEESMRRLIDTQARIRANTETLDVIRQRLARDEKLTDITDLYTNGVAIAAEEYEQKTARQKYAKDEHYFKFREGVWMGRNGDDQAMPPDFITQDLPHEEGDEADSSDEEIAMGGHIQNLKCPLTLQYLTSCLQSKKCKHCYSREAILAYLAEPGAHGTRGGGGGVKPCPATGCDQLVGREDLVENKEVERMAKRAEERDRAAEQGLDEEPVEEVDESLIM